MSLLKVSREKRETEVLPCFVTNAWWLSEYVQFVVACKSSQKEKKEMKTNKKQEERDISD